MRVGKKLTRKPGSSPYFIVGTGLLMLLVIALILAVITFLFGLDRKASTASTMFREQGVWATYQFDTQAQSLLHALQLEEASPGQHKSKDLIFLYDLLYSRVDVLLKGKYAVDYRDGSDLGNLVLQTADDIKAMAETFDAGRTKPVMAPSDVAKVTDQMRDIAVRTHDISIATSDRLSAVKQEDRKELADIYVGSLVSVIAMVIVMLSIFCLLFYQLNRINKHRLEMAELSQFNAEAAAAAEAGNRAKSTFLATLSHEIRTPLNGMIGMIELLEDESLDPEKAKKISVAKRSGQALAEIITDILDFSKMEHGEGQTAELRMFELGRIINVVLELIRPRAESKKLTLTAEYPNVSLVTDPGLLRQILFNLLGNAVKFTTTGDVALKVVIAPDQFGASRLRVEISDTGIGIQQEAIKNLFVEFSQVDSSIRRRFGGTGLGLAISKRLVEALSGNIGVESVYGKGSTFWFEIPVDDVVETAPSTAGAAGRAVSDSISGRALVAEDNEVNQEVAKAMLEKIGFNVEIADDGAIAVDMAKAGAFDVIFMDMQMPNLDGLDATKMIREAGIEVPIIGLTGNAFDSDRKACLAAGMNDFIPKPFNREQLSKSVSAWFPRAS